MKEQKFSLEDVHELVTQMTIKWCCPSLLKFNYYSNKKTPLVYHQVSYNSQKHIIILFKITHGPFGDCEKTNERTYYCIDYITPLDIENQLLNALTFEGSPFKLIKDKFTKKAEIM